jgi:MFS family permease
MAHPGQPIAANDAHDSPHAVPSSLDRAGSASAPHWSSSSRSLPRSAAPATHRADLRTITATIGTTLLLRFASRVSFGLLVFWLGQRFASATITVLVLEAFYLSELILAPWAGAASDRLGRKPFLLAAPAVGVIAALSLWFAATHFPATSAPRFDLPTVAVLLGLMVGRLFEGATTGLNAPAALGALTDATAGRERLRVRALTAFEVATIAGLAVAIPFAGQISGQFGLHGFLIVVSLHLLGFILLATMVTEPGIRQPQADRHAMRSSLAALRVPVVRVFLPAWCTVNAVAGVWLTLSPLVLTYPDRLADKRFPHQLLYGGLSPQRASMFVGGFGLLFLLGMGLWTGIIPRLRRTSTMLIGIGGLAVSVLAISLINRLQGDLGDPAPGLGAHLMPLVLVSALGILLLSGFPPAALSLVASAAEHVAGHEGAVMGIFAFGLGASQFVGTILAGIAVDRFGLYGLVGFTCFLGVVSLASILATRRAMQDT